MMMYSVKVVNYIRICCSSQELFEKYLERLEADYNPADYDGNLVQKVYYS